LAKARHRAGKRGRGLRPAAAAQSRGSRSTAKSHAGSASKRRRVRARARTCRRESSPWGSDIRDEENRDEAQRRQWKLVKQQIFQASGKIHGIGVRLRPRQSGDHHVVQQRFGLADRRIIEEAEHRRRRRDENAERLRAFAPGSRIVIQHDENRERLDRRGLLDRAGGAHGEARTAARRGSTAC
jgi:hypothetical protein